MIKRNYYKIVRVFPDPSSYFYIKNETMNEGQIDFSPSWLSIVNLEYSFDKVNWRRVDFNYIWVPADSYLYLRNNTGTFCTSEYNTVIYTHFDCSFGGDIRTLFNYTDVDSVTKIPDYGFYQPISSYGTKCIDISNLSFRGITEIGNYGLYAENVFLKGALISEGLYENEKIYSGINTLSNIDMFSDSSNDNNIKNQLIQSGAKIGKIVMWAGAPSLENGDIDLQAANFKVDNYGNLYANSGYFIGTIITDATITASKIRTAEIEGYRYKNSNGEVIDTVAALSIKNADIGIKFDSDAGTVMELKTTGLSLNTDLNIGNNFTVRSNSSTIIPLVCISNTRKEEDIMVLSPNKLGFTYISNIPNTLEDFNDINYNGYIKYNEDGLSIFENNIAITSFKNDFIKAKQNIQITGQVISFADENGDRVKWQTIRNDSGIIGYDLYLI